jgi:hypothetical protein
MKSLSLPQGHRSAAVKLSAAAFAVLALQNSAPAALVGQWIGDNYTSGNWADSTGNGHTAIPAGTLSTTDNFFNGHRAVNFSGGTFDGYFRVANNPGTLQGATALTLVAVFHPVDNGLSSGSQFWQNAGLIGNEQGGAVSDWGLGYGGTLARMGVGGPDTTISSTGAVTLNATHVMIGTWASDGTMALYLDGVQVAQTTTAPTAPRSAQAIPDFALGANLGLNNGDTKVFNGMIAEFRVYNDATQNIAQLTNDLTNTYAVPEPGSITLITFGVLSALGLRRRSRAA